MSSTITYKGDTLTTVDRETKTLKTAGKYLEDDITVTDPGSVFIQGEFTTNSSNGVQSITIPYGGSGYPIICSVVAKGGVYENTTWRDVVQQYTVGFWTMAKTYMSTTPTYEASGTANYGTVIVTYKNSTTSNDSYARTGSVNHNVYTSSNPTTTANAVVKFKENKTMAVYVNSSGYGLLPNTVYSYYIIYSA